MRSPSLAAQWQLDRSIAFLNHGSFGACPRAVLEVQHTLRERLEAEPVRFMLRELPELMDSARAQLAAFLDADPEGMAFVPNATTGVNTVLRSLRFEPGDELLLTDHAYNACRNALAFVAERAGAKVVVANVPFPSGGPSEVMEAVLSKASARTRLALLDHVTSPTGLVFPIQALVEKLAERGIDTLVDGAHAPGMLPLSLRTLGAAYYTGNLHKWVCAPKGSAFLHVRADKREAIRPLSISHGANAPSGGRSRFRLEFDWAGTVDPTPFLCAPTAVQAMGSLVVGGWPEVMRRNRELVLQMRKVIATELGVGPPCPDEMVGSLAALPLPDADGPAASTALDSDPLQDVLLHRFKIEVPVFAWPQPPRRLIRLAAQLYNGMPDIQRLALALRELFSGSGL